MSQHKASTGVGLRQVFVALRDDDGTFEVQGSPAVGVAYQGVRAYKSRALTLNIPEPQRITARGDDRNYYTFNEAPTEVPSGELRSQVFDIDITALLTTTVDYGSGDRRQILLASDKMGEELPAMLYGNQKAVDSSPDSSTYGLRIWRTFFVLNALASLRPPGAEDSAINENIWALTCNSSSQDQYGRTMTSGIHGCTEAAYAIIHSRYKYAYEVFTGDGSETEFTVAQGANAKFETGTSPVRCFVDGVLTSCTMDAAGIVTIAAAADGAKVVVEYEYAD